MTYSNLRGLFMLALAYIGLAVMPSVAYAQAAPAAYEQVQTDEFAQGPEAFFDLVHLVPGVPLTRDDYRQLRAGEPVIDSAFNSTELREAAARDGWGSDRVRRVIDSRLSREGNIFTMHFLTGGVIVRITRWKGVDMDSNCTKAEGFIVAGDSNGQPIFSHVSCNGNWQATFSTAMASAIGQTATNVATLGTQTLLNELTGPRCSGSCGPQQVFNIAGGTAMAASDSRSAAAANVEIGSACGTVGSTCGAQPYPSPHPAGSAPANDNNIALAPTGTGY